MAVKVTRINGRYCISAYNFINFHEVILSNGKMRVLITIYIICFFFCFSCRGQSSPSGGLEVVTFYADLPVKQSVYFEAFGNSGNLYSFNYDRSLLSIKRNSGRFNRYVLRVGVNYFEKLAVPIMVLFDTGNEGYFEFGAGWVPWFSKEKRVDGVAAFAGFRYMPNEGGMTARAGLTPTYMIQGTDHWNMIVGVSVGYSF